MSVPAPFAIGSFIIGDGRPFVIAELSGNHSQEFETAIAMIDAAAEAGVDAIKLQTYHADSMTLPREKGGIVIKDDDNLWQGQSLHSLYQKAATPYEWHRPLFEHAKSKGLIAFSSPFDEQAVEFLASLDVPCYKIASFELTDLPLIACAAAMGKPLIMSTGMASLAEIEEAVDTARSHGCHDIVLLKCTSQYPAKPEDANLMTLPHMKSAFGCHVGLSDHTQGIGVAVASVALGATVIEKHFVLDRSAGGVDAEFSLEPSEFNSLSIEAARAASAIGGVKYGGVVSEEKSKHYRRSIYAVADIESGQALSAENIRILRPALGLAPKYYKRVTGMLAKETIKAGTPIHWNLLDTP